MDDRIAIVVVGHVDHGKSTVMGRLLADTGSLPEGKLEQVRAHCARTARPFEYAFLLDALKDEQAQGITIDTARIFFSSHKRRYVVLDAPGHIEFLRNMITGAAHAQAALLVIDAHEGIQENTRRHATMLSLIGVRQLAVLVNKMDLVGYDEPTFNQLVASFGEFLRELELVPSCFIPVCARDGENIASPARSMPWYDGPTVLEALDNFDTAPPSGRLPFRMPVQDVYKFTEAGDDRRIVAGTVWSGSISAGDEVVFYPSGKRARIKTIEAFNAPQPVAVTAGSATGFTLEQQTYVARGEVAVRADEPKPAVTTRLRVSLFWLGKEPLAPEKDYTLKLGTTRVPMRVESIERVIDASTLVARSHAHTLIRSQIDRNDVAECVLTLGRALAFDTITDIPETGRFVIVENYDIRGGGIIREALADQQSWVRDRVLVRNFKWEASAIPAQERAERHGQRPRLVLITGEHDTDRKAVARELEARLFGAGHLVYFLGIGNVLYGVDADIGRTQADRAEHMRRLAEIANLMLDSGAILIVTAVELAPDDLAIISSAVNPADITTVWLGDDAPGVPSDLQLSEKLDHPDAADRIAALLHEQSVIK